MFVLGLVSVVDLHVVCDGGLCWIFALIFLVPSPFSHLSGDVPYPTIASLVQAERFIIQDIAVRRQ